MAFGQDKDLCRFSVESKRAYIVNDDLNGDGSINAMDSLLSYVLGLLDAGIDNIEMSQNPKMLTIMSDFFPENKTVVNCVSDYKPNLKPCISLIDDDTIDDQIPSSMRYNSVVFANRGGYFSVLVPFMLSLGAKHGKKLPVGLACEGHRVGLTHLYSSDDTYTELNENGRAVKWLHDLMGWNVFNHSMTAQLPMSNTYYVDGINSELAQQIIAENDVYYNPYVFRNCIVLDRLTGKWYELNNQSKNAWVERSPTKKYALPFYQDYVTKKWFFNRDFDFEYSWGEWVKRADELGLPNEKVIVHNGGTSHVYTAFAGRKYANWSIRTNGTHNYPPIAATVNRQVDGSGSNNVRNVAFENSLKSMIDDCFANHTWMVFMTHFNDQQYHCNYYLNGVTYPDGDPNYPSEWIIPLTHEEIQDIIGENTHDYINHPPSRLNISTWDEWHPAPGTQLMSLYNVIDYAITKGVEWVSPMDGWNTHGNMLDMGVDRNGQTYSYNTEPQTPLTEEEQSFLTIGSDMSIRYSFNPDGYTDLSSSDVTISPVEEVVYNGSAQTPEVIVCDGKIPLVNGIHYTVSYSNNIYVGTATVTITGKGHYTGTKTTNFTINDTSVGIAEVVNYIMGIQSEIDVKSADVNGDGLINAADIVILLDGANHIQNATK